MKIANLELKNKYILAPMAGVTDLPFRLLCREQGCALAFTEMVSAKGLYYGDRKTKTLMRTVPEDSPIGVQIFGSDSKIMSEVVKRYLNDSSFRIIDINAGCPTPKIVKNGDGAALLKSPSKLGEIVRSVVNSTDKIVTVKIRTGWDKENINSIEVAKIVQEEGAQAITVHGRTREQFYNGKSNWNLIKEVKNNLDIPVIANGDIRSLSDAQQVLDLTNCDAIMIGRVSLGNPWIFSELNNIETIKKDVLTIIQTAIRHMEMLLEYKPAKVVVGEMRKHIAWYTKGLRDSSELRYDINQSRSIEEIKNLLKSFLDNY